MANGIRRKRKCSNVIYLESSRARLEIQVYLTQYRHHTKLFIINSLSPGKIKI
jgi:hypothetical protein